MNCPYYEDRIFQYYCKAKDGSILRDTYECYCKNNYSKCSLYSSTDISFSENWGNPICGYCEMRNGRHFCEKDNQLIYFGTFSSYCGNYNYDSCPRYSNDSEGCYLTTACAVACKLGDNCMELQILRKFRDEWLKKRPFGEQEIKEYYETAPKLLTCMKQKPRYMELMKEIYASLIAPCVIHIQHEEMQEAYELYKETVNKLKKQYL